VACARVVEIFQDWFSFLSNADWGCLDGNHNAWITVEVDSKDEARFILPPAFRAQAKIVQLNKFTMEEIDEILRHHRG
jgi:nicotinate-nucleotide pyrophosphorylase